MLFVHRVQKNTLMKLMFWSELDRYERLYFCRSDNSGAVFRGKAVHHLRMARVFREDHLIDFVKRRSVAIGRAWAPQLHGPVEAISMLINTLLTDL